MNSYNCFKTRIRIYIYLQGKRSAESDPLVGTVFLTTVQVITKDLLFLMKDLEDDSFFRFFQAPSILVNTELAIDENIGGFSKEV